MPPGIWIGGPQLIGAGLPGVGWAARDCRHQVWLTQLTPMLLPAAPMGNFAPSSKTGRPAGPKAVVRAVLWYTHRCA